MHLVNALLDNTWEGLMPGLYDKSIKIVISNGQSSNSVFQKMTEVSCIRRFKRWDFPACLYKIPSSGGVEKYLVLCLLRKLHCRGINIIWGNWLVQQTYKEWARKAFSFRLLIQSHSPDAKSRNYSEEELLLLVTSWFSSGASSRIQQTRSHSINHWHVWQSVSCPVNQDQELSRRKSVSPQDS